MASISERSPIPLPTDEEPARRPAPPPSTVAIDDPSPVEVVRRDLDADPIPRQDADPETPHLARDVTEDLVAVVELHPEHRVRERLHDLAFEFDLLFLGQELDDPDIRGLRALAGLAELVLHPRALC